MFQGEDYNAEKLSVIGFLLAAVIGNPDNKLENTISTTTAHGCHSFPIDFEILETPTISIDQANFLLKQGDYENLVNHIVPGIDKQLCPVGDIPNELLEKLKEKKSGLVAAMSRDSVLCQQMLQTLAVNTAKPRWQEAQRDRLSKMMTGIDHTPDKLLCLFDARVKIIQDGASKTLEQARSVKRQSSRL